MRRKSVIAMVVAAMGVAACAVAGPVLVDPDAFANGTDISNAFAGVTLSAYGSGTLSPLQSSAVYARGTSFPRAGNASDVVFGNDGLGFDNTQWYSPERHFRADFDLPTDFVSIDIWSNDNYGPVRVRIYDIGGILIDTFDTIGTLGTGVVEVASFTRGTADIAYMTVSNTPVSAGESFLIDSLEFNLIPLPTGAALALVGMGLIGVQRRRAAA
ncbi:hypothetical protein JYU07_00200 [Roseiflexus sp. AH-315-K22]|nr:hypothetical protein [Roseiflexus sp. AH-315-K22]